GVVLRCLTDAILTSVIFLTQVTICWFLEWLPPKDLAISAQALSCLSPLQCFLTLKLAWRWSRVDRRVARRVQAPTNDPARKGHRRSVLARWTRSGGAAGAVGPRLLAVNARAIGVSARCSCCSAPAAGPICR